MQFQNSIIQQYLRIIFKMYNDIYYNQVKIKHILLNLSFLLCQVTFALSSSKVAIQLFFIATKQRKSFTGF